MFKYKLNSFYNVADYTDNFVEHYLKAINIDEVSSFLIGPKPEDELDPYLLENMQKGIDMLHKHITLNSIVYLLVDCDPDGYTSASIVNNYCKNVAPTLRIVHALHETKEHGIEDINNIPSECSLIIIPDAGSSQKDELLALAEHGKDILVLDHHESDVEITHDNIVIINNQLSPRFPNKALSGAGIVFKFIEAYDKQYGDGQYWMKYYDLAMLGGISDVMYSGTLDNNYIFTMGLENIHNKFLKALLEKQSYSVTSTTNPTKIDIAFYITPVINGVIRIGTQEEKENLFRAMANNDINEQVETVYRGQTRIETFYEFVARESANIKSRQDALITKTTEKIFAKIEEQGLQNNQLIIYKTSLSNKEEVPKVLTGLVAMKICAKYNRCTLVVRPQMVDGIQYYMGSGRGKIADGFDSLRDFLVESNLVEMAQGHAMAHGVSIKEENIDKLIEYSNSKLKDVDFGSDVVEVCGINPPIAAVRDFAEHPSIYGNGIPTPTFVFTTVLGSGSYTVMGSRMDTIKFLFNGITFIKFHAKELIQELQEHEGYIDIEIAGRPQINEFRGNSTLQVIIDNYNIRTHSII